MVSYVMIPGHGGSGAGHWQTIWERGLGDRAVRIEPSSWEDVTEAEWSVAISRVAGAETVLVAHSLGCLAAAAWLSDNPRSGVLGAFLVAPPDRNGPSFPAAVGFDRPAATLPIPSVVLSSTNDPFCANSVAVELATAWGAKLLQLGPFGHINAASGLNGWDVGRNHLDQFVAGLT